MKSVLRKAAMAAGVAVLVSAAHADPVFTTIFTANCFGFGVCSPGIPVTQLVETAPGEFLGVMEYGVMYMLSSAGSFSQGYVINDTNTWNSTPLNASDGNLYVPSSSGSADIFEFNLGLTWLASIPTPAYIYASPLVETPDQVLHGASAPGFPTNGQDFTLTLDGTVTSLSETVAVSRLLVSSTGDLYGLTSTALLKFASDGSYTTLATFANAVAGLIEASDGNFYACNGTLFRVTPQGVVTSFPGVPTGYGCVIQASDGLLYGANQDQVYSSTLEGVVSVIYDFNGFDQGQQTSQYVKSIIQGSDGKLYGQTTGELDSNGTIGATIYSLDLGLPKPEPAIVRASARKLAAGATVLITGHNFLGTTSVTIGGRAARFKVRAAEYLEVTAPIHPAVGDVVVTTPNGTATGTFKLLVL
jgi:hypothetical protein